MDSNPKQPIITIQRLRINKKARNRVDEAGVGVGVGVDVDVALLEKTMDLLVGFRSERRTSVEKYSMRNSPLTIFDESSTGRIQLVLAISLKPLFIDLKN